MRVAASPSAKGDTLPGGTVKKSLRYRPFAARTSGVLPRAASAFVRVGMQPIPPKSQRAVNLNCTTAMNVATIAYASVQHVSLADAQTTDGFAGLSHVGITADGINRLYLAINENGV